MAAVSQATELLQTDGIVLHGTVELAQTNTATCHVLEEKYSEEEWERIKGNEGQPLHREGSYVDGEKSGRWVTNYSDGSELVFDW